MQLFTSLKYVSILPLSLGVAKSVMTALIEAGMVKFRVMHGHAENHLHFPHQNYFPHMTTLNTSTCTCQVPLPVFQSLPRRVLK